MILQQPFRLLDLPGEIRNRIYQEILSAFESTSTPDLTPLARILRQEAEPNGINQVSHAIEATILRTCRKVHREAYDVMVKTNSFVRIRVTNPGLSGHLVRTQMPVVTMDRAHVAQFSGYVMQLDMHLDARPEEPTMYPLLDCMEQDPLAYLFMILGRDWVVFCNYFATLTTKETSSKIRIAFRPNSTNLPDYKAPLSDCFLEKTQVSLLNSFRTHARDLREVQITGPVSRTLVTSVLGDVTSKTRLDTCKILSEMQDAHDLASHLFAENKTIEASSTWSRILPHYAGSIRNPTWSSSQSTRETVNRLHFTALVNIGKCYLQHLRNPPPHLSPPFIVLLGFGALGHFTTALHAANSFDSSTNDTIAGVPWQPSTLKVVNLMVEACECRRLLAQTEKKYASVEWLTEIEIKLNDAWRLAPGDEGVERERTAFREWKQRLLKVRAG
ncbi:Nn.00g085570.m01.CDS01 [Neocucurbitaria sp. VM-36]